MNTAIRQLLTSLIGIALLGVTAAQAQQRYISQEQAQAIKSQSYRPAVRVAQQPALSSQVEMASEQFGLPQPSLGSGFSDNAALPTMPAMAPQAVPEGMSPTTNNALPIPPSNGQEDVTAGFPGLSPNGQPVNTMPPHPPGIENGLWDGCEPGEGCAICGGGYCQPPLWFTDQGMRILGRTRAARRTLASEFITTTNVLGQQVNVFSPVFTTRAANYDAAPGYYATIGRYLGRDSQDRDDFLEFNYWGMNTWSSSAFITAGRITNNATGITSGNLFSPFPSEVVGFNGADSENITITSEMHNWELDLRLRPRGRPDQLVLQPNGRWRRECAPGTYCSYLVGLRYMTIGDGFLWNARGTTQDLSQPTTPIINTLGRYNVQTENDLLGFQIGADVIFRRCKWSWGVHTKAGPYVNFARSLQELNNQGAINSQSVLFNDRFNIRRQKVAFIGEVGFEANYKFTPTLAGRAMYDLMWIQGLALAPDQLQFTSTPDNVISTKGGIFAHGLTLALEWSW